MKRIKKILKVITDTGIEDNLNTTDKFRIRFINGLHFLIAIILMIGITHWIILDKKPFTYIELFCLSLSIFGFVLNKMKLFNYSYALFYLYCNFLIVYNIEFYPKEIAGYVYYFPFAMVLGINNLSVIKNKVSYLLLLISFVIFLLVVFTDFSDIIPQSMIVHFSEDEIRWVRDMNIAIAGLCVIFFTYFYMWLSKTQTEEIKKLIEKEKQLQQKLVQSLNQKDVLLAEVHHRVKNNLAILNSIINMNINNSEGKNVNAVLESLQSRIYNMSMVHNLLYTHENIEHIPVHDFAKKVIHSTMKYYDIQNVNITENYDNMGNMKAGAIIPFGIILNEILTNAVHHAFTTHNNPAMSINIYRHHDDVVVHITDNGKTLFNHEHKNGLGIELIHALTEQMNGTVDFSNKGGVSIKISIPKEELLIH